METTNNIDREERYSNIFKTWAHRNPRFEKQYEDGVIRIMNTWMRAADKFTESKAKIFGAAYEVYIIAFFIGLYSNNKRPLSSDTDDLKVLGHPIENWGKNEVRDMRSPYTEIQNYIFIALVAKTNVDWIALDKGEIEAPDVATDLIHTMEEYANYGFSFMSSKLNGDPITGTTGDKGYFFSNRAFLDLFLDLTKENVTSNIDDDDDNKPEALD